MVNVAVFRRYERSRKIQSGESSRKGPFARPGHSRNQGVRRAEKVHLRASQSQPKALFRFAEAARRACSQVLPQHQRQIERAAVKQQPFQDIFVAAQVCPPHAARLI